MYIYSNKIVLSKSLKGTVGVISSDPSLVEWRVQFTIVSFKPLIDQGCQTYHY